MQETEEMQDLLLFIQSYFRTKQNFVTGGPFRWNLKIQN